MSGIIRCDMPIMVQIAETVRIGKSVSGKQGRGEYKKRGESVEWVFGNIKQNLGLREFLTRGVERVRTEWNLVCTAHNLKVMWGKLRENMGVLCEIGNSWGSRRLRQGNYWVFIQF